MTEQRMKWLFTTVGAMTIGILAVVVWQRYGDNGKNEGIASGNGRIEAVEIDIAAKTAGRIKDILATEGEFVNAGQIVATMDTKVLDAQRREAEAHLRKAQSAVETVHNQIEQRQSEKAAAMALMAQRQAELDAVQKRLLRSEPLALAGAISTQEMDDHRALALNAQAAVRAAKARIAATEAAIATAKPQRFVADVAQFTPKTVETASERQKLMFLVKAQIAPELLKKHIRRVKTGLPGMAYVRLDPRIEVQTPYG